MIRKTLQLPNTIYESGKGVIKTSEKEVPITNVSAHLSVAGDLLIEGIIV